MKKIIFIITLLTVVIAGLLTGCGSNNSARIDDDKTYIYYLNPSETQLYPIEYDVQGSTQQEVAEELMNMLLNPPQDRDALVPLEDNVEFNEIYVENNIVYLSFDSNYQNMKTKRRTLCNAALAKTFSQINLVNAISVKSGGNPLLDNSGSPVGLMSSDDFITSVSDINAFTHNEVVLFFASEDGQKLESEKREVVYNMNTPIEKVVLEELISGPYNSNHMPVLQNTTKLLSVSVNEGTCYVNFDESFLVAIQGEPDYIPIYAIVNTLSELPNISRVQIMVNSSTDVNFRETLSLNTSFERNLEYIKGE